ncbi:non-ribosomal peptide synthase/polyketide synthase [Streptomyces californicus]
MLRTDTSGNPTFRELLARVRETDLAAYAHQEVPFERLVEVLNPTRSLAHHPLFQVMILFQNNAEADLSLPGLRAGLEDVGSGVAKFDLDFDMQENHGPDGERRVGEPARHRCSRPACEDHRSTDRPPLRAVVPTRLAAVSGDPGRPADPRNCCADGNPRAGRNAWELLAQWTAPAPPSERTTVPALFEAAAAAHPEAIAVAEGTERLTYAQLNAGRTDSPTPSSPRAWARSPWSRSPCRAAWTSWWASSASSRPVASTCRWIRTTRPSASPSSWRTLALPSSSPASARTWPCPTAAPTSSSRNWPTDPSPIRRARPCALTTARTSCYTSGSTGRPKGVLVPHQNVVRLFTRTDQWFGFDASDVWTLFHSYAFDFSVWELWGPLLRGGTLVVVPQDVSRSPARLPAAARGRARHRAQPDPVRLLPAHAGRRGEPRHGAVAQVRGLRR